MKRIIIILLAFIPGILMAQENQNEYKSIFNKKSDQKIDNGGFGSFGVGYGQIDGRDAINMTINGAWLINHSVALGFSGTGFFNNLDKSTSTNQDYLGGGYGGFFFQPILFPNIPVHLAFPIVIGGGAISTIPQDYWDWSVPPYYNDYDVFFVVEPGIELEINMVRFFRFAIGATYRYTNGVLLSYPDGTEVPLRALDGFNFHATFKFGKF